MSYFAEEKILNYPHAWEDEYRKTGFVQLWRDTYPELFAHHDGSSMPGTLDLFAQYALMFLLRREQGIESITWYKLASTPETSKNRGRTLKYWAVMQNWMGHENFRSLRDRLREEGFTTFTGEPDLFCWDQETGRWFFAEAKRSDSLTESQRKWFQVCHDVLGTLSDIRVYRLEPDSQEAPKNAYP